VCITPASGGEELHLYETQVVKDLVDLCPSSLTFRHFEGTDRRFPLYAAFPRSEYYDASDALVCHWWTAHLNIHTGASHVHTNTLYEMV
jgi:hypothetical protein